MHFAFGVLIFFLIHLVLVDLSSMDRRHEVDGRMLPRGAHQGAALIRWL